MAAAAAHAPGSPSKTAVRVLRHPVPLREAAASPSPTSFSTSASSSLPFLKTGLSLLFLLYIFSTQSTRLPLAQSPAILLNASLSA